MKYIFSRDGKKALKSHCSPDTLFAFDFDGTLSKIVDNPNKARMSKKTGTLLKALEKLAPVAIISGRSLKDINRLLIYKPKNVIGNHGLEGLRSHLNFLKGARNITKNWKKILKKSLKEETDIFIECKKYSLAVHYRGSKSVNLAKLIILEACTVLTPPPRIVMGKLVINLIPPGAPHKGMALLELMLKNKSQSAIYVGDDDTDEDAFSLHKANLLSIRVSKSDKSSAQFFIEKQNDIDEVLKQIIELLKDKY